jgi:archaellum component FlaC
MSEEKIVLRKDFLEYMKIENTQGSLEDLSGVELDIEIKKCRKAMEILEDIHNDIHKNNGPKIGKQSHYDEFLDYLEKEEYEKMVKFIVV